MKVGARNAMTGEDKIRMPHGSWKNVVNTEAIQPPPFTDNDAPAFVLYLDEQ